MRDPENFADRHRFSDGTRTYVSMRPTTGANWAAIGVILTCIAFWAWVIWEGTR